MKITYRKTATGWRLRYIADNHKIITSAEGYERKADCLTAISLLKAAAQAQIIEGHPDKPNTWHPQPLKGFRRIFFWKAENNDWRWRYSGSNGEPIWWGQGFASSQNCLESIGLIQLAAYATTEEEFDSPFSGLAAARRNTL